jgi:hypothetical protein
MKRIAVLYSGGVDSTAAAVILEKQFDQIHLLSFRRLGLFNVERTGRNVELLKAKFGKEKFSHIIIDINKLFRMISYAKYFQSLKRYGFFLLSTCGLCKLSMHVRALIYCLDNDIHFVADGANKHMVYFPDQTGSYINEIKDFYSKFQISYLNPVFNFDCPEEDIDWFHKLGVETEDSAGNNSSSRKHTTSQLLFEDGILHITNAKAKKINQTTQARCFQLTLFNIFLHWYFLPNYGMSKYEQFTSEFYKERIRFVSGMLDEYLNSKKNSLLNKYLE